jgi:hypothetical protein
MEEENAEPGQLLWEQQQRVAVVRNGRVNRMILRNFVLVLGAIALTIAAVFLAGTPASGIR